MPPSLLRFGGDVQAERGLAGGFRSEDLGDAPARNAADAERDIERERTGGDDLDLERVGFTQAHDGTIAVALDDVAEGFVEHRALGIAHRFGVVELIVFFGV